MICTLSNSSCTSLSMLTQLWTHKALPHTLEDLFFSRLPDSVWTACNWLDSTLLQQAKQPGDSTACKAAGRATQQQASQAHLQLLLRLVPEAPLGGQLLLQAAQLHLQLRRLLTPCLLLAWCCCGAGAGAWCRCVASGCQILASCLRARVQPSHAVPAWLCRQPHIMVVVGGVIPPSDFQALLDAGAAAIFPPGTVIAEAAIKLLEQLNARLGYSQQAA